jgi:hypothetical protein
MMTTMATTTTMMTMTMTLVDQVQAGEAIANSSNHQQQPQELQELLEGDNSSSSFHLSGLKIKSSTYHPVDSPYYEEKQYQSFSMDEWINNNKDWTLEDILTCLVLVLLIIFLICCICSCCCNILCGGPDCCCCKNQSSNRYYGRNDTGFTICGLSMCDILACICIWEICCDDRRRDNHYLRLP